MPSRTPRILKYLLLFLITLGLFLLLFINSNLAAVADMVRPGAGLWTHVALLGFEVLALGWFWRGLFRGPRHLLLLDKTTPEAQLGFEKELKRRMRSNAYIKKSGINPLLENGREDPEYLERCMETLKQAADEEIKRSARRVFLATALVQNGRLDALIVFAALCRLVWRVSSIYNQRPHPNELLSLYWAVASTTFLAFSIEELDIATEVTVGFGEALHAIAPAGFTASIPFAGSVLQTFTASTIDGTANCYLALRAGIITRNAYSYSWRLEKKPSRADVFKEAGALLMGMSQELVSKVATTVGSSLTNAAKNVFISAGDKTVRTGKGLVVGIGKVGQEIGSGANKIASGTVSGATRIATETVGAMDKLASGVVDTAAKVSSGAEKVVTGTTHAMNATRDGISSVYELTNSKMKSLAHTSGTPVRLLVGNVKARLLGQKKDTSLVPEEQHASTPNVESDSSAARNRYRGLLGKKKKASRGN